MILDSLFNTEPNLILKKLLDFSIENQKVIAHNLANVETPGFIAKKLEFHHTLKAAVESGDLRRIAEIQPVLTENLETPFRMDMNNVDIEYELARMDENRLQFELVSSMLKSKLKNWAETFEKIDK